MAATDPLNFVSSTPKEVFSKLNYKELKGPIKADFFSAPETKNYQQFTTPVAPFTVPNNYSLNDLWCRVWAPKTFIEIYKKKRNETKFECPDWQFNADRSCCTRLIKNIVIVDAPMPDTPTQFVEAHRIAAVQQNGKYELWFQHSAQTPDVISGSSFRVETLIVASADFPDNGPVTMTFTGNVLKCSAAFFAVKFIAVPRAMRETGDAMRLYCKTMEDFVKSGAPGGVGGGVTSAVPSPTGEPVGEAEGGQAQAAGAAAKETASSGGGASGVGTPTPAAYGGGAGGAAMMPEAVGAVGGGGLLQSALPLGGLVVALGVMAVVASRSFDTLTRLERSVELQNRRWAFVEQHVAVPFGGLGGLMSTTTNAAGASGEGHDAPFSSRGASAIPPYTQFVGGGGFGVNDAVPPSAYNMPQYPQTHSNANANGRASGLSTAGQGNNDETDAGNQQKKGDYGKVSGAEGATRETESQQGEEKVTHPYSDRSSRSSSRAAHRPHRGAPHGGSGSSNANWHSYSDPYESSAIPRWAHIVVGEVAALQTRLASAYWFIGAQLVLTIMYLVRRFYRFVQSLSPSPSTSKRRGGAEGAPSSAADISDKTKVEGRVGESPRFSQTTTSLADLATTSAGGNAVGGGRGAAEVGGIDLNSNSSNLLMNAILASNSILQHQQQQQQQQQYAGAGGRRGSTNSMVASNLSSHRVIGSMGAPMNSANPTTHHDAAYANYNNTNNTNNNTTPPMTNFPPMGSATVRNSDRGSAQILINGAMGPFPSLQQQQQYLSSKTKTGQGQGHYSFAAPMADSTGIGYPSVTSSSSESSSLHRPPNHDAHRSKPHAHHHHGSSASGGPSYLHNSSTLQHMTDGTHQSPRLYQSGGTFGDENTAYNNGTYTRGRDYNREQQQQLQQQSSISVAQGEVCPPPDGEVCRSTSASFAAANVAASYPPTLPCVVPQQQQQQYQPEPQPYPSSSAEPTPLAAYEPVVYEKNEGHRPTSLGGGYVGNAYTAGLAEQSANMIMELQKQLQEQQLQLQLAQQQLLAQSQHAQHGPPSPETFRHVSQPQQEGGARNTMHA